MSAAVYLRGQFRLLLKLVVALVVVMSTEGFCAKGQISAPPPEHGARHHDRYHESGHRVSKARDHARNYRTSGRSGASEPEPFEAEAGEPLSVMEIALKVNHIKWPSCNYRKIASYAPELLRPGRLSAASAREKALIAHGFRALEGSPYQRQATDVIRALAKSMLSIPPEELYEWMPQNVSMVLGAFRWASKQGVIIKAIEVIARDIAYRGTRLEDEPPWSIIALRTFCTAFINLEGETAHQALEAVAKVVIERGSELLDDDGSKVSALVTIANSLSKVKGELAQSALREIADMMVTSHGGLWRRYDWKAKDLSLMANALSKSEGKRVFRALKVIARTILERREEIYDPRTWSAQQFSMAANGISKAEGDDIDDALGLLARAVVERDELKDKQEWSEKRLAMFANGICKGRITDVRQALKKIARAVLKRRRELNDWELWSSQPLAMLANGISKVEGDKKVDRALSLIAEAIVDRACQLGNREAWPLAFVAMVANGISKVEGDRTVNAALNLIAREALARDVGLKQGTVWGGRDLSMLADAFVKASGPDIAEALGQIARELVLQKSKLNDRQLWRVQHLVTIANVIAKFPPEDRFTQALNTIADVVVDQADRLADVKVWSPHNLGLVANALARTEADGGREALGSIAEAVLKREQELKDGHSWSPLQLALMTTGICKYCEVSEIKALELLAGEVVQRRQQLFDRGEWSVKLLAMLSHGISRIVGDTAAEALRCIGEATLVRREEPPSDDGKRANDLGWLAGGMYQSSSLPVLEYVVGELMEYAASEPHELAWLLVSMARWHLLDAHLPLAAGLFQRLREVNYSPADRVLLERLMWSATLMRHISTLADSALAEVFARSYHSYHDQWLEIAPVARSYKSEKDACDKWQTVFANDYWQPELETPVISSPRKTSLDSSDYQKRIFEALGKALPRQQMTMELRINYFPIDILLENNIAIEVDGPFHFIPCEAHQEEALGCRRAKDLLIEHMLSRYNFKLVRIPYTVEPDTPAFNDIITRIRMLLDKRCSGR